MDSIKYITIKGTTYKLEGGEGNISAVKIGDAPYTPDSNGVISLPAYPTGGDAGYSVLPARYGGEDESLVTTGDKYNWNNALKPTDASKVTNMILYGQPSKPLGQQDIINITSENISNYATSGLVTVVNGTSPLAWNTDVTIGTINGTAITAKLPAKPTYEKSHYTATPIVGIQGTTSNSTSEVTSPYLNIVENGGVSGSVKIQGTGSVSVSGRNGIITIAGAPIGGNSRGISSINKTGENGNVDTYTITYTDNTTSTFTIHNGVVDYSIIERLISRIETLESYHNIVSAPVITGNTPFTTSTTVSITVPSDTTVRYTTNGSEPTSSSTVYNGPFTISNSTTVKAKAFKGNSSSETVSKEFIKEQLVVNAPVINGTTPFDDSTIVTMTADSGAEIRYTLNGSNPTTSSTKYNSAITLTDSATIKAIAIKDGVTSSITIKVFTKNEPITVDAPIINGTTPFDDSTFVTITATGADEIRYTTDGSNPTLSSNIYGGPIELTDTTTIQAIAVKNGVSSTITSKEFIKNEPVTVSAPTISGITPFDDTTTVTISAESGAQIRYTTNGSTPNSSSNLYTSAFTLSDSAIVKAIAIKNGTTSSVATKVFTKNEPVVVTVSNPTINGTNPFDDSTVVTITTTESGATTYYTTDGTEPTIYSQTGGSFSISDTTTVKARSYKNGTWSETVTVIFTKNEPVPAEGDPYTVSKTIPTAQQLESVLDTTASKPSEYSTLNTSSLGITRPTVVHVIYPQDWNSTPVITDSNDNPVQGGNDNTTTPTITVNGRVYRVFDIRLGVDNFKIQFN